MVNLDNYNVVRVIDDYDNTITGVILLNNKHNVEEFRKDITNAKNKHIEEIIEYGCDWDYIEQELENYDYYMLSFESNDYVSY
jgi:hypothetical protein